MWVRPERRSFHAFNVSLAKTGTRSVAGIFARYRSLHEYLLPDTIRAVVDREHGSRNEARFREFVHWRDGLAQLDMDSSSCNCYFADALAQEFHDVKLLLVIRDCFSWIDSLLNMVLFAGPLMAPRTEGYMRRFLGSRYDRELVHRPADLKRALPQMIDHGLRHWGDTNRFVLRHLPASRSLIVRTHDLNRSLPALAAFADAPVNTLRSDLVRLNGAQHRYHLLREVDPRVLIDGFEQHCHDLMREFFPQFNVAEFIANRS